MDNKLKIEKVSKLMYWACIAYLIISLIITLMLNAWLAVSPESALSVSIWDMSESLLTKLLAEHTGFVQRLSAQLIGLIPFGLSLYGVWRISRLFKSCKQGLYFTTTNASHLFVSAMMMALSMLLGPLADMLMELVLTLGAVDASVSLSITLGPAVFQTLFVSCTFMAFSWIMLEGKKIAAENAEFV